MLTIEPVNRNALLTINNVTLADDESHYACDVWRTRAKLFTAAGLR